MTSKQIAQSIPHVKLNCKARRDEAFAMLTRDEQPQPLRFGLVRSGPAVRRAEGLLL